MAFAKGFAQIRRAKQQADQEQKARAASRTRDVILRKDGDEVRLWFVGSPEKEPVEAYYHTIKTMSGGAERFAFELCASGFEGHEGCVNCWAIQNGDKRVGKRARNFLFSVADTRYVHKLKNEEKSRGSQFEKFDWTDCPIDGEDPDSKNCKQCRLGVLREPRGLSRLRLGVTVASNLDGENTRLGKKCLACGGKIKHLGFRNGKRVVEDLEDVSDPSEWEPQYECTKCDKPAPGSIFVCPVIMRRSGTGKATSYNFSSEPGEDMPEWVQKLEPTNLEEALVPASADKMAEVLGIRNPFEPWAQGQGGKPRGAISYDEDESPAPAPATHHRRAAGFDDI